MARKPQILHQEIVDYILDGHSTKDAQKYFDFASENIANIRIYSAFKRLGLKRPHFQEKKICEFCNFPFIARSFNQRTCGKEKCQKALILQWQKRNKPKINEAQKKYKKSSAGRESNIAMHARKRQKGTFGTSVDKWNYAAEESTKRLRKLRELLIRNKWEYRIQHIQKLSTIKRVFNKRAERNLTRIAFYNKQYSNTDLWGPAFRAVQNTLYQLESTHKQSQWENAVSRVANAIRIGGQNRKWKNQRRTQLFP